MEFFWRYKIGMLSLNVIFRYKFQAEIWVTQIYMQSEWKRSKPAGSQARFTGFSFGLCRLLPWASYLILWRFGFLIYKLYVKHGIIMPPSSWGFNEWIELGDYKKHRQGLRLFVKVIVVVTVNILYIERIGYGCNIHFRLLKHFNGHYLLKWLCLRFHVMINKAIPCDTMLIAFDHAN